MSWATAYTLCLCIYLAATIISNQNKFEKWYQRPQINQIVLHCPSNPITIIFSFIFGQYKNQHSNTSRCRTGNRYTHTYSIHRQARTHTCSSGVHSRTSAHTMQLGFVNIAAAYGSTVWHSNPHRRRLLKKPSERKKKKKWNEHHRRTKDNNFVCGCFQLIFVLFVLFLLLPAIIIFVNEYRACVSYPSAQSHIVVVWIHWIVNWKWKKKKMSSETVKNVSGNFIDCFLCVQYNREEFQCGNAMVVWFDCYPWPWTMVVLSERIERIGGCVLWESVLVKSNGNAYRRQ